MSEDTYRHVRAFIVTPFGKKKDSKGNEIDFQEVYDKLLDKALEKLKITGRTTGEIVRAGSIHADMFQRLLTADIVVAEVSIHNANVFYELGIRHALRQHGTVLVRGEARAAKQEEGAAGEGKKEQDKRNDEVPFDILGFRYLVYDRADPAASVDALADAIRATLDTPDQDSPVFRSLPNLGEQPRSRFLPVPPDFREEVELALANKQRGDLTLLGLETKGFQWGVEGLRVVGRAQFQLRDLNSARATWEEVRDAYPNDIEANTRLGTIYQKLGDLPTSDIALKRVLANREATPYEKAEAYSLQASNAKVRWKQEWQPRPAEEQGTAALRSGFLQDSFKLYERGFDEDLSHFYSGLNALAMLTVTVELARKHADVWAGSYWPESEDEEDPAADALKTLVKKQADLAPSALLSIRTNIKRLQWEVENAPDEATRADKREKLIWAKISEADHACLTAKQADRVGRSYRNCLKDVQDFFKHTAYDQLLLYKSLGILEKNVGAGIAEALPPEPPGPAQEQPRVFVFTGHRIDDPGRVAAGKGKRFPPEMEPVAREAIKAAIVAELGEGNTNAVGIAGGASGGDILFHEVCRELKIKTHLYLALPRADYIAASVQDAGEGWVRRFNNLYDTLDKRELSRSNDMPRWLREKDGEYGVWQRSNLWILTNAVALDKKGGGSNLTLIALWNGKQGDGAGGTEDMTAQARKRGAQTRILPTEELFQLGA